MAKSSNAKRKLLNQTLANPGNAAIIAPPRLSVGAIVVVSLLGLAVGILPWNWLIGDTVIVLTLAQPIFGLALLILSVSAQDTLHVFGSLSLTQVAVPLALFSWLLYVLAHPKQILRLGSSSAAWILFLVCLLIATAFSPYSTSEGIKELWRWGAAFIAWLIATTIANKPWHTVLIVAALLLAPFLNAILGIMQFVSGDGPAAFRIATGSAFSRAYGTIGQPNSFAGYMNLAWPLALALAVTSSMQLWAVQRDKGTKEHKNKLDSKAIRTKNREPRADLFQPGTLFTIEIALPYVKYAVTALISIVLWVITLVLLAALGASFSRGAWLGAGIGLVGMALATGIAHGWHITWQNAVLISLGIAGCIVGIIALNAFGMLPTTITTRVTSILASFSFFDPGTVQITDQNFAVVERMAQLWAGWQMFLAHPLTGVGPGSYSLAYPAVASSPWFASRGHAHNYYLHIAAEAGILGLSSYLILLGTIVYGLSKGLRHQSARISRAILIGSCGIIAAMAGHNVFENLHVLHLSIQSAAAMGIATTLVHGPKE